MMVLFQKPTSSHLAELSSFLPAQPSSRNFFRPKIQVKNWASDPVRQAFFLAGSPQRQKCNHVCTPTYSLSYHISVCSRRCNSEWRRKPKGVSAVNYQWCMDMYSRRYSAGVGREVLGLSGQSLRVCAGLEKQEIHFPLSHSTTGSDCLSLMGTTLRDEFRASPSLPALKKEKSAKIQ